MKRWVIVIVLTSVLLGAAVLLNVIAPERLTPERIQASERAAASLEAVRRMGDTPASERTARASSSFRVRFECSNGAFVVECFPEWAPKGAARFREAVEQGIYDDTRFFRVVPEFIVQFGIPGDPAVAEKWRNDRIEDDPVTESNVEGSLCFATSGPNSRTTQLFINLADNADLDQRGFTPVGRVVEGMGVVEAITDKYGQAPDQGEIQTRGNAYLNAEFPDMDYIKKARILDKDEGKG